MRGSEAELGLPVPRTPSGKGCWGRRWSLRDWQGGAQSQGFSLPGALSSSGTALI